MIQIFERLAKTQDSSRMLFLGEAGVGKTTLLAKIAYDWAKGRRLQNIDILLYVPLREFQTSLHFGDIVQRYVSRETLKLRPKMITNYAKTNQENVMLLLDGFDEYSGDIEKCQSLEWSCRDFERGRTTKGTRSCNNTTVASWWTSRNRQKGYLVHECYCRRFQAWKREGVYQEILRRWPGFRRSPGQPRDGGGKSGRWKHGAVSYLLLHALPHVEGEVQTWNNTKVTNIFPTFSRNGSVACRSMGVKEILHEECQALRQQFER